MELVKTLFRLLFILAVPVAVAAATYLVIDANFFAPADPSNTQTTLVEVSPAKTFKQVSKDLQARGIVKRWWVMVVISRLRRDDTRINAGEYELSPAMTPLQILKKLVSGQTFKRRLTVIEGMTMWDIGPLLEQAGILTQLDFERVIVDSNLTRKAGVEASSFEGYLFPETYLFTRPITPEAVLWRMLEEGEKHWPRLYTERADELKLSRHEVLTLASIIEKEAGNIEEMPYVSSVFHNRLRQGMKLQADPTVIYALPEFDGNLRKVDLQVDSPYNTYMHFGLPPGPICNPGDAAIKAALYPADTQFLYFVGTGEGRHVFSASLEEHNGYVRQFQLGRK